MPLRHPEALPQYRTCTDCGRSLILSSENFALRKGPGRYPWQPSAYAPRCKACQPAHLKALRAATKAVRYAKETERQRKRRAVEKASHGFGRWPTEAERIAAKAKEASKLQWAAMKAEARRTLRAGRPYSPATDPIKIMIRERQGYYLAKRLRAGAVSAPTFGPHQSREVDQDYLRQLEALRDKSRRDGE
jgi:hypothetical protein